MKNSLLRKTLLYLFIGIIFIFLSVYFVDSWFSRFWDSEELMPIRKFARAITDLGQSEIYFLSMLLLIIFFKWFAPKLDSFKNKMDQVKKWQAWAQNFFICLLTSGIAVHLVKFAVGRQRPHRSDTFESGVFFPFSLHWHYNSFPSGHSQVAFTVATMFVYLYPKHKNLVFFLAGVLAFTRVVTHDHFLSDVIGGFLVGHLVSLWTLFFLNRKKLNANPA